MAAAVKAVSGKRDRTLEVFDIGKRSTTSMHAFVARDDYKGTYASRSAFGRFSKSSAGSALSQRAKSGERAKKKR